MLVPLSQEVQQMYLLINKKRKKERKKILRGVSGGIALFGIIYDANTLSTLLFSLFFNSHNIILKKCVGTATGGFVFNTS